MSQILLIEDDANVRDVMRQLLEALGHEVRTACDGDEGLEQFRLEPTPIVVTDLLMPQKEGLETIRELRELQDDVRILAISGGGVMMQADSILDLAVRLGADEVLPKPFGSAQLSEALDRLEGLDRPQSTPA